jgi:hypothetical protein
MLAFAATSYACCQALNALVFLYRNVLERPLGECTGIVRAKRPARLPVVLTAAEAGSILRELKGVHGLVACLQYGSGLRLLESVLPIRLIAKMVVRC